MATPYLVVEPLRPETGVEFAVEVVRDTIEVARVPMVALAAATISLAGDVSMSMLAWLFENPCYNLDDRALWKTPVAPTATVE